MWFIAFYGESLVPTITIYNIPNVGYFLTMEVCVQEFDKKLSWYCADIGMLNAPTASVKFWGEDCHVCGQSRGSRRGGHYV